MPDLPTTMDSSLRVRYVNHTGMCVCVSSAGSIRGVNNVCARADMVKNSTCERVCVVSCRLVKNSYVKQHAKSHFFGNVHKARALWAVGSLTSRAADGRGYRHRRQHSCQEHAHCGSVDPSIISWVHRTDGPPARRTHIVFLTPKSL